MTLKGHEQAVWSVALISEQGLMLTGELMFDSLQYCENIVNLGHFVGAP